MAKVHLTMALSHYDRHIPFLEGSVRPEGIDLDVLFVGQSEPLSGGARRHERMLQNGEFDICELSLSSYLIARSRGMPFTAIPVFPRRLFSFSQIWVHSDAGIKTPSDLIGRTVGLSTFQTTLSVLAKGDLQSEYGVPWRRIEWVVAKEEALPIKPQDGIRIQVIAPGKRIGAMLESGEIDALVIPHPPKEILRGSGRVRRLFADSKKEEMAYFGKRGFYPIMHLMAFKESVLEQHPWIAGSMMEAFEKANELSAEQYDDPNWSRLAWGRHLFEEEKAFFGGDPWASGLRRNRANLEMFMSYSLDQGLMEKLLSVEDLFHPKSIGV
jgi:4,5-dihydroxyphthalate decarboxylase